MDPQATVIIPTYEDWDDLQLCLECLARQTVDSAVFEVIVANNNGSPEVPATLRLPDNVRILHVPKPGSYAARNAAIAAARGKVLFFTDSDCLPVPEWIEAGLAEMAKLGPLDLVAGAVELFPAGPDWTAVELYDLVYHMLQERNAAEGWSVTANLLARPEAFKRYGGFDDQHLSGADQAWTKGATARGSKMVFSRAAMIRHPARKDFSAMAKKRRRQAGGVHYREITGQIERRPFIHYLAFPKAWRVKEALLRPGLTGRQRMQLIGVDILLGFVILKEVFRLRYLAKTPSRS